MINGSRGPMLRKATALDWTGDPIEVKNRFTRLVHGEQSYEQMLAHFKDYNDVAGDHPLNLLSTTLALNAYLATGEQKYRAWLLGIRRRLARADDGQWQHHSLERRAGRKDRAERRAASGTAALMVGASRPSCRRRASGKPQSRAVEFHRVYECLPVDAR
jgi:hypothetical protein